MRGRTAYDIGFGTSRSKRTRSDARSASLPARPAAFVAVCVIVAAACLSPSRILAQDSANSRDPSVIVAFGDSTTAPRGALRVYADIIRDELPKRGIDAEVFNAGVGGNHTAAARKRFERDVLERRPDVVIIQFGINDSAVDVWKKPPATKPRVSLKRYEENLRYFVRSIRQAGAKPLLMTPNPLRWTPKLKKLYGKPPYDADDEDGFNVLLENYAEKVREIARDVEVPLIDIWKAMQPKADALLLDGMHPNTKGQALVAERLLPQIRGILQDGR